jgi:DMSO/TMAO reductase YedYZ molybdopterin-dependent catalytic subunit
MRPIHIRPRLLVLALLPFVLAGCAPAAAPAPTATPAPPAPAIFDLSAPGGTRSFTMEQLQALPVTEGQGGWMSSTGKITVPALYSGVALKDLAPLLDVGLDASMGLTLTAEDGYSMTFSFDQVANGTFTAHDPGTGKELETHDPLTAILAYARDGQPLDPKEDGALRVQVISATNNQVVDGHWSIKWVTRAEIVPVGADWSLELQGALTDDVDRASFQSCSAPSCHGVSWKDEMAQPWAGVPLWHLVGQVDDEIDHGDDGYNEALAAAGYTVDLIARDGASVTLDSQAFDRNDDVILAAQVNDAELPETYFPLRLVGPGLQEGQMIGQITRIVVHVPPPAPPTPEPVPPRSVAIAGKVANALTLSEDGLRAMGAVSLSAEDPKQGTIEVEGVRLSALMNIVQVLPEATKAVFTAADGYSAELDLETLRACADCLIGFTETPGSYRAVMPGQPGALWVKDLVRVEFQ